MKRPIVRDRATPSARAAATGRASAAAATLAACLPLAIAVSAARAEESAQALAARSAIVVRASVVELAASDEPMLAASPSTAIVAISETIAGRDVAGEQKGRRATVVLKDAGRLKVGDEAMFFGNPRFIGRTLTIVDEGELPVAANAAAQSADVRRGVDAGASRALSARVAEASAIFRGTVQSIEPAALAASPASREPPSEHDPQWQVAAVRVATPIRGGEPGKTVRVLFAASRDIMWFNAPKLANGQDAVFIAHVPERAMAERYRESGLAALVDRGAAYVVVEPSDVLPASDEARVRALVSPAKEKRP